MKAFAEYIASAMYFAEAFLTETAEQLFGVEPRSEADCEYPLEKNN